MVFTTPYGTRRNGRDDRLGAVFTSPKRLHRDAREELDRIDVGQRFPRVSGGVRAELPGITSV